MIKTLSDALAERGYDTLTEVQQAVTAPELRGADLLVSAQTGSGKTVGFGLAFAADLLGDNEQLGPAAEPLALIVAPTRELALQVMRELGWLYSKAGARVASCVGGMDMRQERRALDRGAHIVVGTPGRLRDHIQRGSLDMSSLRVIVLDEADEMLDLGFREDLEFMLDAAPEGRRTLMFSATVPQAIAKLAERFQKNAVRVTTASGASQHSDISYQALRVSAQDAENAIFNLLRFHDAKNALVFGNTRVAVNHLTARLANRGFAVVSLSGELSQTERTHALQAMRDGRARVCVATDVAARGIDLPGLELVIHAELPSNADGLLHRSGRTGRAGHKGISALIIAPKAVKKAERLLRFAKIKAEWMTAPSAEDILRRDEERLLTDPVWSEETTPEQAEFATKLLAQHTPETIAAAYLRLYRARLSAPEELAAPDAAAPRKERQRFGPSGWFALSVGHDDRAEARWLLPMLLRATNLDKEAIGAIRVQQKETFVEIAERAIPDLLAQLGNNGKVEKNVRMRALDGPPDAVSSGRNPASKRPDTRRPYDRASETPGRSKRSKPRDDRQDEKSERSEVARGKPQSERPTGKPSRDKKPKQGQGQPDKSKSKNPGKNTPQNARDPSKRLSRPGKPDRRRVEGSAAGKSGSKRSGGDQPLRRKKK